MSLRICVAGWAGKVAGLCDFKQKDTGRGLAWVASSALAAAGRHSWRDITSKSQIFVGIGCDQSISPPASLRRLLFVFYGRYRRPGGERVRRGAAIRADGNADRNEERTFAARPCLNPPRRIFGRRPWFVWKVTHFFDPLTMEYNELPELLRERCATQYFVKEERKTGHASKLRGSQSKCSRSTDAIEFDHEAEQTELPALNIEEPIFRQNRTSL